MQNTTEEIKPEDSIIDDIGADSLDVVEISMEIESRFQINIPDEDVEKMQSVQDVIDYIEARLTK